LRIFNRFFTHLLYIPVYARLQIFIQLSPTLTSVASQYEINTFLMSTNMLDMT